jgi:hypothetical protein
MWYVLSLTMAVDFLILFYTHLTSRVASPAKVVAARAHGG